MSIADWYKRLRHGRGFGVHSPLAYDMVRETLCPPALYAYYIYDELPALRKHYPTPLANHDLRLIFRVAVRMRPSSVTIAAQSPAILEHLIRLAVPGAKIKRTGGEMLICEGMCTPEGADALSGLKTAVFTDSGNPALQQIWDGVARGHLYCNPTRAVLIVSDDVPRQKFDIRF